MTWLWIALGVLVLLILVVLLVRASKRGQERKARKEAARMRAEAQALDTELRERDAHAQQAEVRAEEARADAERVRSQRDEQLRRADAVDPDVERGRRRGDERADVRLAQPWQERGYRDGGTVGGTFVDRRRGDLRRLDDDVPGHGDSGGHGDGVDEPGARTGSSKHVGPTPQTDADPRR